MSRQRGENATRRAILALGLRTTPGNGPSPVTKRRFNGAKPSIGNLAINSGYAKRGCNRAVPDNGKDTTMDRDRIEGSAKSIVGRIKSFLGRFLGDDKLRAEGRVDQTEGRVQN